MTTYVYRCAHGDFDARFPMGTAPGSTPCARGCAAQRVFTAPHVTEDRVRFWRNNQGTRYSSALGADLPDTRRDVEALARSRGIEMLPRAEIPDNVRRTIEYGRHLRSGGDRIDNATAAAMMEPPKPPVKTVLERVRESNFKKPDLAGPMRLPPLPAFPKDVSP